MMRTPAITVRIAGLKRSAVQIAGEETRLLQSGNFVTAKKVNSKRNSRRRLTILTDEEFGKSAGLGVLK